MGFEDEGVGCDGELIGRYEGGHLSNLPPATSHNALP